MRWIDHCKIGRKNLSLFLLACDVYVIFLPFTGDLPGLQEIWIVGDNFMAKSYREHFEKIDADQFFMKKNYEVKKNCNSRYSSNNTNLLSRFVNSVISLINANGALPAFLVVVLDNDIVEFLNYNNTGVSALTGKWLEYIVQEVDKALRARRKQLPPKLQSQLTQCYWVDCMQHKNFNDGKVRAIIQSVFGHCAEEV